MFFLKLFFVIIIFPNQGKLNEKFCKVLLHVMKVKQLHLF